MTVLTLVFVLQTAIAFGPIAQTRPDLMQIEDLTPPSDAMLEKAVVNAAKAETESRRGNDFLSTEEGSGFTFRQEVEEVVLYATVLGSKGDHMVCNLDRSAFAVLEDEKPQEITSVRSEDIPIALGIIIDNSGSMDNKRPAVNQAALNLVHAGNPKDQTFLVNFDNEFYLDQDFTSDIELLRAAIERRDSTSGGTSLYDAVIASADHFAESVTLKRRVLLVLTDGEDNSSRSTLKDLLKAVQKDNGPTIYTVGILDPESGNVDAKRALKQIAEATGGIAFLPKSAKEVDAITRAVAHDIRNQYAIAYRPTRPSSEGGYRSVKVKAQLGKEKFKVRTKSGYFAAGGNERAAITPIER